MVTKRERRALLAYVRWWRYSSPWGERRPRDFKVAIECLEGLSAFYSPRVTPLNFDEIAESMALEWT